MVTDEQEPSDTLDQLCRDLGLDAWQVAILTALSANPAVAFDPLALAISSRRQYKAEAHRRMVALALARGEHVHIVEPGGKLTCANQTCTEEQLKPPKRAPDPPLEYYDESWRLSADHPMLPELLGRRTTSDPDDEEHG